MKRIAFAFLLVIVAFNSLATTITRISPESIEANSGEHLLIIYGTELDTTAVFSSQAGEFKVEGGLTEDLSALYVGVPVEVMVEPGEVKVTVRDASAILKIVAPPTPPLQVQMADPIVVAAEGRWGATVDYEVSVIGGRDPNPTVKCEPPSGSVFPLGPTHVDCVATNSFGERAEGGAYVYVADYGVPLVRVPDRIRVQAESPEGARVEFQVSATDVIDGELPVTCNPQSGSLFRVGETTVLCVATDSSYNEGHGEFVVEVLPAEKEQLVLHLPDPIEAEATGPDGAEVTFEVTASGTSDPNPEVDCDPKSGSTFPFGETTVKCVARDSLGNSAEGSFTVTVTDTVAPIITTLVASPDKLEPNLKWEDVKIDVEAFDVVDAMPVCRVVDITTNQPGGGAEITGDLTVRLLAERDEKLGDRRYDIRVECTDESKNTASGIANVIVPKGKVDEGDSSSPSTANPPKNKRWVRIRRS